MYWSQIPEVLGPSDRSPKRVSTWSNFFRCQPPSEPFEPAMAMSGWRSPESKTADPLSWAQALSVSHSRFGIPPRSTSSTLVNWWALSQSRRRCLRRSGSG